jgi:hypothetical protein
MSLLTALLLSALVSFGQQNQNPPAGIEAKAWLDSYEVDSGARLRLWVQLRNWGPETADEVRLLPFRSAALDPAEPACWKDGIPVCDADLQPTGGVYSLAAGETLTVSGAVVVRQSGAYRPVVTFRWMLRPQAQPALGAAPAAAASPRVRVDQVQLPALTVRGVSSYDFIKDILIPGLLPLTIALLGYVINQRDKRQQVWRENLERFQAYVTGYYLPIVQAAIALRRDTLAPPAALGADREMLLLYRLLVFLKKMRRLAEDKGGFLFRSRKAEDAAALAWAVFAYRSERVLGGASEKDWLLGRIDSDESIADFRTKFLSRWDSTGERLRKAAGEVVKWVEEQGVPAPFESYAASIGILAQIVEFENNRPMELWYDEKLTPPDENNWTELAEKLPRPPSPGLEDADLWQELRKALGNYRRNLGPGDAWS